MVECVSSEFQKVSPLLLFLFHIEWKKAQRGRQRKVLGRMARTRGEQVVVVGHQVKVLYAEL